MNCHILKDSHTHTRAHTNTYTHEDEPYVWPCVHVVSSSLRACSWHYICAPGHLTLRMSLGIPLYHTLRLQWAHCPCEGHIHTYTHAQKKSHGSEQTKGKKYCKTAKSDRHVHHTTSGNYITIFPDKNWATSILFVASKLFDTTYF